MFEISFDIFTRREQEGSNLFMGKGFIYTDRLNLSETENYIQSFPGLAPRPTIGSGDSLFVRPENK